MNCASDSLERVPDSLLLHNYLYDAKAVLGFIQIQYVDEFLILT